MRKVVARLQLAGTLPSQVLLPLLDLHTLPHTPARDRHHQTAVTIIIGTARRVEAGGALVHQYLGRICLAEGVPAKPKIELLISINLPADTPNLQRRTNVAPRARHPCRPPIIITANDIEAAATIDIPLLPDATDHRAGQREVQGRRGLHGIRTHWRTEGRPQIKQHHVAGGRGQKSQGVTLIHNEREGRSRPTDILGEENPQIASVDVAAIDGIRALRRQRNR